MADHEKAYRWGTNKRFEWNENTHACQIINVQETTEEVVASTSLSTASAFFSGVSESKLLKIGVPQELVARVMAIQNLNDLDKMESVLPVDAYENIFNIMDGENIDAVISEIEEGQAHGKTDKLLSNNNKRRFVELTDDDALRRIIDQGMDKWQIFLHPSQRKLVETDYKGTTKVSGGAGAGKTIAAIHRLKHLCEEPRANVLFTTFTKTLSENLVESIDKLGVAKQKYTLMNIDRVLHDVAERYKVKEGYKVLDYFDYDDEPSLALWREILENEVTEFDEKFLYDDYINVILFYGNKSHS